MQNDSFRTPLFMDRRAALACTALPLLAPLVARGEVLRVSEEQLQTLHLSAQGVRLTVPPVADTSASVPLSAEVEAPTGQLITQMEVRVPANPFTTALVIRLAQPLPRFSFSTRLRLATSQNIWVLATLSDGSQRAAFAPTQVTSSSCYDAS